MYEEFYQNIPNLTNNPLPFLEKSIDRAKDTCAKTYVKHYSLKKQNKCFLISYIDQTNKQTKNFLIVPWLSIVYTNSRDFLSLCL